MGKAARIREAHAAMEGTEVRATQQVLAERERRSAHCLKELLALLERDRCTLEVVATAAGQPGGAPAGVSFTVKVIPLEVAAPPGPGR